MRAPDLSINSYSDLNELNKLKQAGRRDERAALEAAARQFESLFLGMLMKNMRKANEALGGDSLLGNEGKFYQEMFDQQLAMTLTEQRSIGLSDILVRQLLPKARAADAVSDAGQAAFDARALEHAGAAVEAMAAEQSPAAEREAAEDPDRFETPTDFVAALWPLAQKEAPRLGVEPRVLVAQAALETGWGQKIPRHADGRSSYNLFGIKADERWSGDRVWVETLEFRDGLPRKERAAFRAYGSLAESLADYADFLRQSPRYQPALAVADDPVGFVSQLQQAGYATDPRYAAKIANIMNGEVLLGALASI